MAITRKAALTAKAARATARRVLLLIADLQDSETVSNAGADRFEKYRCTEMRPEKQRAGKQADNHDAGDNRGAAPEAGSWQYGKLSHAR